LPTAAELPQAHWPMAPAARSRRLLVRHAALLPGAFDAGNAPLRPAVDNIARLLAHCRAHGIPVFYTAQHGDQDRRDRGLQADLWGPGMRRSADHEPIIDARHRSRASTCW
jgi:bifunctional isochorismate lyase/aryl carrier protein